METQKSTLELNQKAITTLCGTLCALISHEQCSIDEADLYMRHIKLLELYMDEDGKQMLRIFESQGQSFQNEVNDTGNELAKKMIQQHNDKTGDNIPMPE